MSTFKQPCNEMSFSVNTDTEQRKIGWNGITNDTMRFKIKYLDNKFQEILNEKAFSLEMFWSYQFRDYILDMKLHHVLGLLKKHHGGI